MPEPVPGIGRFFGQIAYNVLETNTTQTIPMDESIKILLVSDEEFVRQSLITRLENMNYVVSAVPHGEKALYHFRNNNPDLVFSDFKRPEGNSHEFLNNISKENGEVPLIIFSESLVDGNVQRALEVGAWDYFHTPVQDSNILHHVIAKGLERRDLIREARKYQGLFEESVRERTAELEKDGQERKRIEAMILKAKREWESTVDSMPDLIALLDVDHTIIRLNKAMSEVLGVSPKDAVGKRYCLYDHSDSTTASPCPHDLLMADGNIHITEFFQKETNRYYEVRAIPYSDRADAQIKGSVLLARDITEMKNAQKEKDIMQAKLLQAQKLESVGQLAAGIAHEINTPTQYVGSNIEFLDEAYRDIAAFMAEMVEFSRDLPEELASRLREKIEESDWEYLSGEIPLSLQQSQDGVSRVSAIVHAMKKFSHPGSCNKEQANINEIIETTLTVTSSEWKYLADVTTDFQANLPTLPCLIDEIGQVILNILVNAAQSIGSKLGANSEGRKGCITITTRQDDEWVKVVIQDTGEGVSRDIANRIFDPFFTTKEVGKGTGQGLAIARDVIVEKHDGTIELESEPGEGAIFTIRLPLQDGAIVESP